MKKKIYVLLIVFVLLFCFCFCFFYLGNKREHQLIKEGDILIEKIEKFRRKHGKLPNSLKEMGIEEKGVWGGCCGKGADLLYYEKKDSLYYIVFFGTTLGEGVYYFSDTQQWENRLRGIGN